jgi:hypothetical protein
MRHPASFPEVNFGRRAVGSETLEGIPHLFPDLATNPDPDVAAVRPPILDRLARRFVQRVTRRGKSLVA